MAKTKKQPAAQEPTPTASQAAAPAAVKKPAAKKAAKPTKAAASAPTGMPMIDTSLAAQTAAKLVAHRDLRQPASADEGRQESSAFKQLKENLNKAASGSTASFLQSTAPVKKQNSVFGDNKQVSRNQTFGADVNRSGVPRRTGG